MLKCSCKFSFRVAPTPPKDSDPEKVSESPQLREPHIFVHQSSADQFDLHEEDTQDQVSGLEEDDLKDYLSSLKKSQQEKVGVREDREEKIPTPSIQALEIDIDHDRMIKAPSPSEASSLIESLEEASEGSPPGPASEGRASSRTAQPRQVPVYQETFFEKIQILFRNQPLLGFGSIGIILFVSAFGIFQLTRTPEEVPEVDEFLEEMLTRREPSPGRINSGRSPRSASTKTDARPKSRSLKSTSSSTNKARSADTPEQKIVRGMSQGQFGEIQRQLSQVSNYSAEARAFIYESYFLSPDVSPQKKEQIFEILKKDVIQNPRASVLKRSEALGLSALGRNSEALSIFNSLLITRSSDEWVYVYTGWIYHQTEKQQLALQAWNQALTINSNLEWVRERRESIIQSIVYQD
jgi:hypothetical protein